MQSPRCQQRSARQDKPATLLLAGLLAIPRPIAAFSSADPRWINLPGVAAYLVGHPRARSADRAPPLIQPTFLELVARCGRLLCSVRLKAKARRCVGAPELQ